MANLSFALRLAFGLIPKTEKLEEQRNQLIAEFERLNKYKESDELKTYNELQKYVGSDEYKKLKASITSLNYATSDECRKEKRYQSLTKDKSIRNYFNVAQSDNLKRFEALEASDLQSRLQTMAAELQTAEFAAARKAKETKAECKQKERDYKALLKSPDNKFRNKYKNSKSYNLYLQTKDSQLLKEYNELSEYIKTEEFSKQKAYLLDKDRFSKTEEAKKEAKFVEMDNSDNIKWYKSVVNSNKFDILKEWNLTFSDEFDATIDTSKWMNSFFMGKMMLNDRYVISTDNQYYTDNKNISVKQSVLTISTKKEKTEGRVWDAKHGFYTKNFDYTSGMINTAGCFRQQYGKFEAKIKIDASNAVYQAFWLKGERKEPQIDIFKYNIGRKGSMQLSTYNQGNAAGNKFSGSALAKDFYIYSVEWDANSITWKINDYVVAKTNKAVPHEQLYINFAAGLNKQANDANLPSNMEIDWVRCYEKVK